MLNTMNMNSYIQRIKKEFNNNPDLVIKEIKINILNKVYIIFLDTLCSQDKINNYILKKLTNIKNNFEIERNVLLKTIKPILV